MPRKKKDEAVEAASEPTEATESKPKRRSRQADPAVAVEKPKAARAADTADAGGPKEREPPRPLRKRPVSGPKPISEAAASAPVIGFVFRGPDSKPEAKGEAKKPTRTRRPPAKKPEA